MLEFHDISQNSDEWESMRGGRATSSMLSKVMANYGKAFGEPAKKYAYQIAVEQITGKPVAGGYHNEEMDRGHEEEPIARMLYEDETFLEVSNGGFFCSETVGCSPDGLVGSSGVIEIKSAIVSIHYERVRKASFDPAHKWQLIANMKWPCREWIDFISYCKDFPEDKRLYVYRLWADQFEKEFSMIDQRVAEFLELVAETKKNINESIYINQSRAA